jgi:O-antigen ligase
VDGLALAAGLCAVPVSIAVSETFLTIALVTRIVRLARHRVALNWPVVCWLWLGWTGLEVVSWLHSPELRAGTGEIRHLLLIAAVFTILPALRDSVAVWRGILLTSTAGAVWLISLTISHHARSGGFLHNWMVYSVVEILIFGALLEFRASYPDEWKWTTPVLILHCMAILLSMTRTLWIVCFLIAAAHLLWRRSKWIVVLPMLPVAAFLLAPSVVHARVMDSSHFDYYSNTERIQMWRVGWKMIREHPAFGVGPGRVEELYTSYLASGDPVPAYHGHLHNNALEIAAQFGLPVLAAAILWLAFLLKELVRVYRWTWSRETRFLCRSAFLGIGGFLAAGMTDYTYGHALGLILFSFVAIAPLLRR